MSEFDKAVKHVKTCLFWDFVDGQWLEKLYTPLDRDFFNRLMQGVVETHEAENAKLRQQLADVTESMGRVEERCAKLRELAKKLKACNGSCGRCIELYGICEHENEMQALGIEVDA